MRVSSWKGGIVGVLMAVAAACNQPTEPTLSTSFTLDSSSSTETAAAISYAGGVSVTGVLTIADPCYAGAAAVTRWGTDLTLSLSGGIHRSGGCATVLAGLDYQVAIPLS